jgi:tetratricopeptide (TPR) repeat protein
MGFVLALLGFLVAGARAEESPLKASDLHLLKTDLPPGWVPLNKPVDTEEAKQIREAFETIKQKAAGLSLSMQGIDASGQHLNLVFIGFPDEKTVKDLGAFITLLFGKRFPRRYGTVYALVMSENEKLAAYLHEKIARRFAFVRINRIDAMIKSGRNPEAAEALQKLVPTLPPVSEAYLRVGDLFLFHLRPPKPKDALKAFQKAIELHAKDTLDPIRLANTWYGIGRAHAVLGDAKKAVESLGKGAEAAHEIAKRVASRILVEKARVQAQLNDLDGCFESLQTAFEREASLGFSFAARDALEDPTLDTILRKPKFASLTKRFARTRPVEALIPPSPVPLDLIHLPLAIVPIHIEGNRNPAAGLEEAMEKGLRTGFRGAGTFKINYRDWGGPTIKWIGREFGEKVWEAIEEFGCFDLRLTGPRDTRGRGAEIASDLAEESLTKGIAFKRPVHLLLVTLKMEKKKKSVLLQVTAGIVEDTGKILVACRFKRKSGSSQKNLRSEMSRIAIEIFRRFARALKK